MSKKMMSKKLSEEAKALIVTATNRIRRTAVTRRSAAMFSRSKKVVR